MAVDPSFSSEIIIKSVISYLATNLVTRYQLKFSARQNHVESTMYLNKVSKLLNLWFMALGFETTKSQVVYVNEWKRENCDL